MRRPASWMRQRAAGRRASATSSTSCSASATRSPTVAIPTACRPRARSTTRPPPWAPCRGSSGPSAAAARRVRPRPTTPTTSRSRASSAGSDRRRRHAGRSEMTQSESRVERYRDARARVLDRIAAACARAGRSPEAVTLVAVSKTVAADALRDAVSAGLDLLGENRVQEAAGKAPEVPGARWQLVGPLQSNKARRALEVFEAIQSVDSVDLARRLDRLVPEVRPGRPYRVLLQVNVDLDPAKAGFAPDDLDGALESLVDLPNLAIGGLMTVGRLAADPADARRTFAELRATSERCRARWPALGLDLSMGMSDDFEVAIEEGATIVRVGRALFGERAHAHGDGSHTHAEGRS